MVKITGIVETSLYVNDLAAAKDFYLRLFSCEVLAEDRRFCALNIGPANVLLLFGKGQSAEPLNTPGGVIPAHGGDGEIHLALGIATNDLVTWKQKLIELKVPLESVVTWPRGGTSLYFRDLDNHLLELITPGVWANY